MTAAKAVFRLPTLAVSSGFEPPVLPATLPYDLVSGADPALAVVEGAYRPEGSVCRFTQPTGLVVVRLADPVPAVLRVVLTLRSDRYADDRWSERVARLAAVRAVRGVDRDGAPGEVPDPHGRLRSVRLHCYGRERGGALLVNDGSEDGWARQRIAFDVPATELEAGMLLLGFGSGTEPDGALADGLVGLCLARVRVLASDGLGRGSVSTGLLADDDGWMPYREGAIVTPPDDRPVRLEVRRVGDSEARQGLLRRRGRSDEFPGLEVVSPATGLPILPESVEAGVASYRLPGDAGPLRIALAGDPGSGGYEVRTGPPPR